MIEFRRIQWAVKIITVVWQHQLSNVLWSSATGWPLFTELRHKFLKKIVILFVTENFIISLRTDPFVNPCSTVHLLRLSYTSDPAREKNCWGILGLLWRGTAYLKMQRCQNSNKKYRVRAFASISLHLFGGCLSTTINFKVLLCIMCSGQLSSPNSWWVQLAIWFVSPL